MITIRKWLQQCSPSCSSHARVAQLQAQEPGQETWPWPKALLLLSSNSEEEWFHRQDSWARCRAGFSGGFVMDFITARKVFGDFWVRFLVNKRGCTNFPSPISALFVSQGQTCLRNPCNELEDHEPGLSGICLCTHNAPRSTKNSHFGENLQWLRRFYYNSHLILLATHILPSFI